MAIILMLAAMGSFGWSAIKNRARVRVAENDCQHLAMATQSYYTIMGWWPASANWNGYNIYTSYVSSAFHVITVDNFFFQTLNPNAGVGGNTTRTVRYLSGDISEFNKELRMTDPWGNPYMLRYDISDTNCIPHPFKQNQFLRYPVIVWSAGPDGLLSTNAPFNDAVNKDNVISWTETL
jgi:type II secretory pathway pseudopilin PulG